MKRRVWPALLALALMVVALAHSIPGDHQHHHLDALPPGNFDICISHTHDNTVAEHIHCTAIASPVPSDTATPTPTPTRTPYQPPRVSTPTPDDGGDHDTRTSDSDHAQPTPTATATPSGPLAHVGIGWMAADGSEIVPVGFVRDGSLGQTYAVVRRELDGAVVRYWVAPDSALAVVVPWEEVIRDFTYPVEVIITIPLDDQYPRPDQVARRFDGGDERIFSYDYGMDFWRQVPDEATFQVLGFYWCNVTAADSGFWERVTIGVPHPPTSLPEQADYPNCQPTGD